MGNAAEQTLFPTLQDGPKGFFCLPEFITQAEERVILREIKKIRLSSVIMKGYEAKRRAAHFGFNYNFDQRRIFPGRAIPEFLFLLRNRLGKWADINPKDFVEVLLAEYPARAGIGWHRDGPEFKEIAGISLSGEARFRLRPIFWGTSRKATKREIFSHILKPRSAYIMSGPSRQDRQHSIPPGRSFRYSITFRTLRT